MQRILVPELLDSLEPHDPDAVHSRRDLRLMNQLLGSHRWLARTLRGMLRVDDVALELGAGTGELAQSLAADGLAADAIDRWPQPKNWPSERTWHVADLREFNGYDRYPVVFGNLIFHHFDERELLMLGQILQRHARVIVACEPARRRSSQKLFAAIAPLFRANRVTLHDAHISIGAGFVAEELPRALGLSPASWLCRCRTTLLGSYQMIAVRR